MLRANRALILFVLLALTLGMSQPVSASPVASQPAQAGAEPVPDTPRFDAPTYGVRGPYTVGVRDFVIEPAEEGQRPLTVSVWYPASNPEGKPEAVTYTTAFPTDVNPSFSVAGQALVDAEPDLSGGPYPLVVFSHAGWAWRQAAPFLLEHLASHGFAVISADHEDNWGNAFENFYRSEISRPQDISREIDFAETLTAADGDLARLIDTEKVAVTGHSLGGSVAMEMGGARLNLIEHQEKYCAANPTDMRCGFYADKFDEMARLAGLDAVPDGPWPDWSDPRVDVVMPLEPGEGTFGVQPATVRVPVLLMEGTEDPPGIGLEGLSSEQETGVIFENAGHFIFGDSCTAVPAMAEVGYGLFCTDPVWDMDRAHDLINHFATAFLLAELKGDADAAAALAPENVSFPGIEYSSEGFEALEGAESEAPKTISGFAQNNGVRIHYEVEGQGPPLVLVHWASGSTQDWRMFGYVDALKDKYQLILIDMRGHGKSDKPHDPAAYDAATQVLDIVAVLDDLDIDKANYFGYSLGGRLGWAIAKYAPERLQSLIIGGHIPAVWDDSDWATWMLDTGVDAWSLTIEDFARSMDKWSPEILPAYSANDLEAVALASHGLNSQDLARDLPDLQIPVLLLAGTNDDMFPEMEAAAKRLPNATMVPLTGLDHGQGYLSTDQVLPPITEFLTKVNAEAPAPTAADIRSTLAAANDKFMATYAQGDAAGMAALYTKDGQLLPPNADLVTGKPAIQQFWQSLMDAGITGVNLEILEAEAAGDTAYEVSRYTTLAGDQVADQGKYIVIWKQVDGEWKLHRDIFNSSMPD